MSQNYIINDPVHGVIELHPLLIKIINTPEFARLKDIKQLSLCYWVYPGASHNRFEHCVGTAHLCGKLIDTLQKIHHEEVKEHNIIQVEITDKECLCVKIAGLCHDLGHGPFSHFFDGVYIPRARKEFPKRWAKVKSWEHEDASCFMFDLMIKNNPSLKKEFEENGLTPKDHQFIKDLIRGKEPEKDDGKKECPARTFLYEIVANKRNGIDCDKFDYFARDSLNVGVTSNFDTQRYFHNTRIIVHDKKLLIHVRDKDIFNLYELFHTRWSLHHRVYQHKTQFPIEEKLVEALLKVDKDLKISDSIIENDYECYTYLTDSIFYEILRRGKEKNARENFKNAREKLLEIQRRDLWKCCDQVEIDPTKKLDEKKIKDSVVEHNKKRLQLEIDPEKKLDEKEIKDSLTKHEKNLEQDDFYLKVVKIHFGMKEKDPINEVCFFNKEGKYISPEDTRATQSISKGMLPQKFHEKFLRVYANIKKEEKENNEEKNKIKAVREAFQNWRQSDEGKKLLGVDQMDNSA